MDDLVCAYQGAGMTPHIARRWQAGLDGIKRLDRMWLANGLLRPFPLNEVPPGVSIPPEPSSVDKAIPVSSSCATASRMTNANPQPYYTTVFGNDQPTDNGRANKCDRGQCGLVGAVGSTHRPTRHALPPASITSEAGARGKDTLAPTS